jgi:hypothetical protein
LYKLNKNTNLTNVILRGNYLTKKVLKNNHKQTLIFLRAPKHFNIGKHKVSSFVNFYKYSYNLKVKLSTKQFLINKNFFFNFFNIFHKIHFLYIINSVKIKTTIKIKW